MIFLSKWVIYRFHVNLPGCTSRFSVRFFRAFSLPEFAQVYQLQPPDPTAPKSWSQSRGMFLWRLFFFFGGGDVFCWGSSLVVPVF